MSVIVTAEPVYDYGCFASSGAGLHDPATSRALGPMVELSGRTGARDLVAVRPFFVHESDLHSGRESMDVFWPAGHFRWWKNETDWRFLNLFYHDPDAADPTSAYRFWLLPLIAVGRSKEGDDYGAFFPLGGRVDNWFGRDRIEFVLFPLYWHSELNDLKTDHVLWPLISRTTGNEVYRFRVFPFYARAETKGVGEQRSILWPFWSTVRYDRPGSRGGGFMLFPFYGHAKTEGSETWMILPPFFRHSTGREGTENVYLWPFVQTQTSKDLDKLYVWPLYGRRTTEREMRRFWLWPFIWNRTESRPDRSVSRVRVFPFMDSEVTRLNGANSSVVDRYMCVWPLGSYERIQDGGKRVRVPDLWPFRNTPAIERNLTPWWTLYRYEQTAVGHETDILWGLIHWGSTTNGAAHCSIFPLASWGCGTAEGTTKNWDFLKGMLGYRHDVSGTEWRVLYFINWRTKP